jgi:hypothetical protein
MSFGFQQRNSLSTYSVKPCFVNMESRPEIFFSYAWGDEKEPGESREKIVNDLYKTLLKEKYPVVRDKYDLQYQQFISDFMQRIGKGKCIIIVISGKYVKSPFCMFELYEIARNSNFDKQLFAEKVLPVRIESIDFTNAVVINEYFDYWDKQYNEWDELVKKRSRDLSIEQLQRYDKIKMIQQHFGKLTDWIADMNTLSVDLLSKNNFAEIKKAIAKIAAANSLQQAGKTNQPATLHYNIPLRPNYFIGRNKKLKDIHQMLSGKKQRKKILLVSGIGGMGKTTLVQEYLYQPVCRDYFRRIIVVSVNKNLETAFVQAAAEALHLDIKSFPKPADQLQIVKENLVKCDGNNLFVIDNINESDKDDLVKMRDHFNATGWLFLITTRTVPDQFTVLRVDELEITEAVELFRHYYITDAGETAGIKNLLEHIHRHTLLTELLAKTGKKKGLSVDRLLDALKAQDTKHRDLQRTIDTGLHGKTAYKLSTDTLHHYVLSLFDPEYLDENGKTMLRFFSILPPDDMVIGDLKILWRVIKDEENAFEDRLDELQQSGWLSGKHKEQQGQVAQNISFKMHPLVQEVVYEKLSPNIQNVKPLVLTINDILKKPSSHPKTFQAFAKSVIDKLNYLNQKAS